MPFKETGLIIYFSVETFDAKSNNKFSNETYEKKNSKQNQINILESPNVFCKQIFPEVCSENGRREFQII